MSHALVDKLKLYQVPDYVHGGNIPASHFQRPYPDEKPAAPSLKKADSIGVSMYKRPGLARRGAWALPCCACPGRTCLDAHTACSPFDACPNAVL